MAVSSAVLDTAMPNLHHHALTCGRHRRFDSYGAALSHYIGQLRANVCDPGQEVFRCTACRGWHHGGGIVSLERLIREAAGRPDREATDA